MKSLLIFLALLLYTLSPQLVLSEDLITEHYKLTISSNCAEGHVTCDDVDLIAVNKQSGNIVVQLSGSTPHSMCADGVTPCRFLGYEFKSDSVTYFVSDDGTLTIKENNSDRLIKEKGAWQ